MKWSTKSTQSAPNEVSNATRQIYRNWRAEINAVEIYLHNTKMNLVRKDTIIMTSRRVNTLAINQMAVDQISEKRTLRPPDPIRIASKQGSHSIQNSTIREWRKLAAGNRHRQRMSTQGLFPTVETCGTYRANQNIKRANISTTTYRHRIMLFLNQKKL